MEKPKPYLDFQRLPIIGRRIACYDQSVAAKGLVATAQDLLTSHGCEIRTIYDSPQTQPALADDPVLLIVTHPHDADPAVTIAALPAEREDIYIFAGSDILGFGENTAQHILPVWNLMYEKKKGFYQNVFRMARRRIGAPLLPQNEAKRANLKTLTDATQKLDDGGLIVIFPEKDRPSQGEWNHGGIGALLERAKNQNIKIVLCHIQGTKRTDWLRASRMAGRLLPPFRPVVRFSEPINIIDANSSGSTKKEKVEQLEKLYHKWLRAIASNVV